MPHSSKRFLGLSLRALGGLLFSALIPLAAYFFLRSKGHDGHIQLPKYYGIEKIDTTSQNGSVKMDTSYHQLSNASFVNQLGDTVFINDTYKGKILVVNFFFTHCNTICPTMSNNMQRLHNAFKKNDTSVRFLSITVDPKNDDIPALRAYAERLEANHDKWHFLTGEKASIYQFARRELYLNLPEGSGAEDDFIHPETFVLVDKYRNIRGYYNGLYADSVKVCADDIAKLILEKNRLHEKRKRS